MTLGEIAEELVNKIDQLLMQKDYIGAEHIVNKRLREVVEECATAADGFHDHADCGHGEGYIDGRHDAGAAIRARS